VSGNLSLPFNAGLLGDDFTPCRPGDEVPGRHGVWVILLNDSLVVRDDDGLLSLPEGERPAWVTGEEETPCIGHWQGRPVRALSLPDTTDIPLPFVAESFHAQETRLDDRFSTLAGLAGQILHWERRSRFCSRCAMAVKRIPGTWGKRCPACGDEHFPHIHPCVIVLVRRRDEFLLVRHAQRLTGRYSLIAGFLDFGESLEECVQREVREEAGVEVTNIRYAGSQNWPFPSQQMIGFLADYAGGRIRPDGVEIADARWFTAETLPQYPGAIRSIARWMLTTCTTREKGKT
jgi:NAD+ diphosphatase